MAMVQIDTAVLSVLLEHAAENAANIDQTAQTVGPDISPIYRARANRAWDAALLALAAVQTDPGVNVSVGFAGLTYPV